MLPVALGLTGPVYLVGALVIGVGLFLVGTSLAASGSVADARRLLRASVVYLPAWLLLTIADITF
jgi:protoheme IX farnesyltransferase